MDNQKGLLIVISGFSGAGKGTVVKKLIEGDDYALSISATTRQPRVNEVHGQEYFFIGKEEFEAKIKQDAFFEWAEYCHNYYGTPKEFVFKQLDEGKNVILEIEAQGAFKIREQYPEAKLIFVTAPTIEELRKRLVGRNTESMEVIEKRLHRAYEEVDLIDEYDYFVVNDEVSACANSIHQIVCAEHMRVNRYEALQQDLKTQFRAIISVD